MELELKNKLPTPNELRENIPISGKASQARKIRINEIKDIFRGISDKFILIIGPCSADNIDGVCAYTERLAKVQEEVKDKIIIVPRIYTNKPRTTCEGYKGIMIQPNPNKSPNLLEGIKAMRELHKKILTNFYMPTADELLYPEIYSYISDILGYVAVGARSVENQQHRIVASGIDVPVGMKNPTFGSTSVMLNSIKAAQMGHQFMYNNWEVKSDGNLLTHAILRGAIDSNGRNVPNYYYEDLAKLIEDYKKMKLFNPAIIVDCNHSNSMKKYYEQPRIAKEVLISRRYDPAIKNIVKGLMIESYIEGGRQEIGENIFGKSITDACISWEDSKRLIYFLAENV